MGSEALFNNTTGLSNTANGYQALFSNTTGGSNTANGVQALYRSTGGGNIALGFQAGVNLTTGANNIDIGNPGVASESNKIRIGRQGTHNGTFMAGISCMEVSGSQVVVNANGKLGVTVSPARFKKDIKSIGKTSEAIFLLRPVTFQYKGDSTNTPNFGLIAEEVAKVNPNLIIVDNEGKPQTVRYEQINAMLLNEFLKARRQIDAEQEQIEALTAGLQRVSAQFAATSPSVPNVR
jgi:hypothetical protein